MYNPIEWDMDSTIISKWIWTVCLEENFAQIHLPNWQFYLPWAVGQWAMSSPVCVGNTSTCVLAVGFIFCSVITFDYLNLSYYGRH